MTRWQFFAGAGDRKDRGHPTKKLDVESMSEFLKTGLSAANCSVASLLSVNFHEQHGKPVVCKCLKPTR